MREERPLSASSMGCGAGRLELLLVADTAANAGIARTVGMQPLAEARAGH